MHFEILHTLISCLSYTCLDMNVYMVTTQASTIWLKYIMMESIWTSHM